MTIKNVYPMKSIFYLLLFSCLGACTITKRVHNPGWHVEWKSNQQNEKQQDVYDEALGMTANLSSNPAFSVQNAPVENPIEMSTEVRSKGTMRFVQIQDEPSAEKGNGQLDVESEVAYESAIEKNASEKNSVTSNPDEPPVLPLAKFAFWLLISSLVCGIIGAFAIPIAILGGLGFIVSFILALVARKKIRSNPEKWSGIKLMKATISICLAILYISLLGGLLLILLASIGGSSGSSWL